MEVSPVDQSQKYIKALIFSSQRLPRVVTVLAGYHTSLLIGTTLLFSCPLCISLVPRGKLPPPLLLLLLLLLSLA